jgi:arylsulfatase
LKRTKVTVGRLPIGKVNIAMEMHTEETFDMGMDTASPVADAYFDRAPFAFNGRIKRLHFENR